MQRTRRCVPQAQEFGRRVRALRERGRISQEKLGELADLHRTYIGHVERGEVNPTLCIVVRLAAVLGVDPSELVHGLPPPDDLPLHPAPAPAP